jgi:hypothetical protein
MLFVILRGEINLKKTIFELMTLLLMLSWSVPVFATTDVPTTTPAVVQTAVTQSTSGGIQAIPIEKVQEKVTKIENALDVVMAPIFHLLSKVSLIGAALILVAALFIGKEAFGKAAGIIGIVAIGVIIAMNIGKITDLIQSIGVWIGQ